MTDEVATRLLEAIAANRLIILSGAGLSMADPSNVPSAANVAQRCAEAYVDKRARHWIRRCWPTSARWHSTSEAKTDLRTFYRAFGTVGRAEWRPERGA